jgi:hypothetical protein
VEVGEMVHSRAPCSYIAGYDWIVYQAFYTGWHIWQYSLASGPLWQYMPHSSLPLLATLTRFLEREKWSKNSIFMTHCTEDRPTAPRLIARGTLSPECEWSWEPLLVRLMREIWWQVIRYGVHRTWMINFDAQG